MYLFTINQENWDQFFIFVFLVSDIVFNVLTVLLVALFFILQNLEYINIFMVLQGFYYSCTTCNNSITIKLLTCITTCIVIHYNTIIFIFEENV